MRILQQTGAALCRIAERVIPDPWILAIGITLVTYMLAVLLTPTGPVQALAFWSGGFWNLLQFGMQMVLILVTGHAVATSPPVAKILGKLADLPRSGPQAAILVSLTASIGSILNWGLGLVAGALLVREIGRRAPLRGLHVHYPLLGAAAYAGLSVWHGGLSGSAPLLVATSDHFLSKEMGSLPIADTLGSALNLATTGGLVIVMALLFWAFHPREEECEGAPGSLWEEHPEPAEEPDPHAPGSFARRLEHSQIIGRVAGTAGLGALVLEQIQQGAHLDLNTMNFGLLFAAVLLHGSTVSFLRAVAEGVRGTSGVILQFPFYAGIMGLMKSSGLAALFSTWLAGTATAATLPLFTFLSAGLVNIFVPSGGGQWAIQGPIAIEAGKALGVPLYKMVMAVAYGDEWTNLIQPFWALPILGMTGLRASQLLGYTAGALAATGLFIGGTLLFF